MTTDPLTNPPPPSPTLLAGLRRCSTHRMAAGVAAGLAEYFDIDPLLVRIGFVLLAVLGGVAVPLYAALWFLVPADDRPTSIAEDLIARLTR